MLPAVFSFFYHQPSLESIRPTNALPAIKLGETVWRHLAPSLPSKESGEAPPPPSSMASLSPGVLLRLLQGMDVTSSGTSPRRSALHGPPSVLQITGIVPALSGPNLLPDQGFYVKISDASHSTFVSLSPDLNDLILADRLQIGQLINARRLEPASPIPILRDFRLLSGRHPCNHNTVDVAHPSPAPKSSPVFRPTAAKPPVPPPEKKKRHSRRHSFANDHHQTLDLIAISSPTTSPLQRSIDKREFKRRSSNTLVELNNTTVGLSADDENYDSDDSRFSFTSSSSSSSSSQLVHRPRKNWNTGGKVAEHRKELKSPNAGVSYAQNFRLKLQFYTNYSIPSD